MGTDFSISPVGVPVATPVVRPQPETTGRAVPTELPPPKAASALTSAAAAASKPSSPEPQLSQNVVIDRGANTIVFQTINQATGQVVSQFPDNAVLQARAYSRALQELTNDRTLYDQFA